MDKNTKNARTLSISPNPKTTTRQQEEGKRGETFIHGKRARWGAIPPVGKRNEWARKEIRRGPPAAFLRERDRDDVGVRSEWVWGRWNSPCLLITPTRLDMCGSTAVIAVVPLGRKYRTPSGSTALPAAVNKYCSAGLAVVP